MTDKPLNPAVEFPLPGLYVMPTVGKPHFDYITLIRSIMQDKVSVQKYNPVLDTEGLFAEPNIGEAKVTKDALLEFDDSYFGPAMRIANRIATIDDFRYWQHQGVFLGLSDTAKVAPGRVSAGTIASYTIRRLTRIDNFLKARKYKRKITNFSSVLSFVEYEPARVVKNRSEFFPTISLMMAPSKTFVFDIFVGGDRLNTFDYGMPTKNQIVAPASMTKDDFDGTLTSNEYNQYKIGLDMAIVQIERTVKESRQKVVMTRDPKVR